MPTCGYCHEKTEDICEDRVTAYTRLPICTVCHQSIKNENRALGLIMGLLALLEMYNYHTGFVMLFLTSLLYVWRSDLF